MPPKKKAKGEQEATEQQLVSAADGSRVGLSHAAAMKSSVLAAAGGEVAVPASGAALKLAAAWLERGDSAIDGGRCIMSASGWMDTLRRWMGGGDGAGDPAVFASLVAAADFLALDRLLDLLLASFGSAATLRATAEAVPQLPSLLVRHLRLENEAAASALIEAVKFPETLSYQQLEYCAGDTTGARRGFLGLSALYDAELKRRKAAVDAEVARHKARRAVAKRWSGEARIKALDREMWDAVEAGDLEAARAAYAEGAHPDLFRESGDILLPFGEYLERGEFNGNNIGCDTYNPAELKRGVSTLMVAAQRGDVEMLGWQLDVGCAVNATQPSDYVHGDGYNFGGMTALACASRLPAVALLLARGAKADVSYVPPQHAPARATAIPRGGLGELEGRASRKLP